MSREAAGQAQAAAAAAAEAEAQALARIQRVRAKKKKQVGECVVKRLTLPKGQTTERSDLCFWEVMSKPLEWQA